MIERAWFVNLIQEKYVKSDNYKDFSKLKDTKSWINYTRKTKFAYDLDVQE